MDYSKLPKLNLKIIVLVVVLGVIAAIGIYEAELRGFIPSIGISIPKPEEIKTQLVIQEENTVISTIENVSSSIVSIQSSTGKNENSIIGIGFIIDSKGLIATNKNSITDSGRYTITTKEGQKYEVRKIYKDPNLDLCLMQLNATSLKALELSDSSKLKLGQTAIAVGRMLGQATNTVSVGVVSNLNNLIKTDAVINADNAGGPLLSSAGQVIGINTVMPGVSGFGYAIPVNAIKHLINNSLNAGEKPFLGIKYRLILNPQGVLVQEVNVSGPAEIAGIKPDDIIIQIDGKVIDTENQVSDIVAGSKPGQQIELTVLRNGQEMRLKAILISMPNQ